MLALNEYDWVMMLTLNRNQVKLRINRHETPQPHCLTWFMDPTQHLDWSGAVQLLAMFSTPLSVIYCSIFMLCHWASLWNWPTNWPETRLTPDSTCRIIFRSESGSQSALNAARLKCKLSVALMDHKVFNTLTSSWFIRAVHAIELFIRTVTQEERQFWKLIWH